MMTKIFKGKDEPLFNRDDRFFKIQPLQPSYLAEVMKDHDQFDAENMLRWWCLSGGIPKYLEWLTRFSAENDDLFEGVISEFSPLIKEGTHRLVEDFGSEHRVYFDILGAISKGNTSRARIESFLDMSVGVHLEKLDEVFDVITKKRPISAYSGAIQPPIPGLSGHPFRFKPDTISGINQPFFALTPESVSG